MAGDRDGANGYKTWHLQRVWRQYGHYRFHAQSVQGAQKSASQISGVVYCSYLSDYW